MVNCILNNNIEIRLIHFVHTLAELFPEDGDDIIMFTIGSPRWCVKKEQPLQSGKQILVWVKVIKPITHIY